MSIIRIFPRNLIHSIRVGRLAWTGLGNETCFPVSGEQGNSICLVKAVLIHTNLLLADIVNIPIADTISVLHYLERHLMGWFPVPAVVKAYWKLNAPTVNVMSTQLI